MSTARIVFLCISVFVLGAVTAFIWVFFDKLGGAILLDILPKPLEAYFVHILYGMAVFYLLTFWYTLKCFRLKV